ncbi:deoxycytidyl transferase, partial [Ascosphaera atra]
MSSIQGRKRSSLTRRQFEEEDELPEPGQGYSPSRFAGFADYMRRKRIKLQDKDVELRLAPPRDKAQIFRGIIVYVNGYTVPSQHEIQRLITSNGGHVVAKLDRMTAVTHIITSVLTPKKREEFQRFKVVKPDWVTESVKAGRLLPWQHFKLLTPRSEQVVPSTAPVASVYSPKKTRSFTQQQERSRRKQSNASFFSCVEILTAPPPQKKAKLEKSKDDVVVSQSPVKDTFKASVEEVVGIPGDEIESGDDTPPPSHPSSISEPPASQPPPTQLPLTTHSPIVSQPPVSQSLPSVPSLPSLPGSIPPTSQPLPPSSPAQVVHSSA